MNYKNFTYAILIILLVGINQVKTQTLFEQLESHVDIVVDANGTGDYTTVQAAINAIPDSNDTRKVILVKKGTYYEKVVLGCKKTFVTLVGEDVDSTIITYDDYANKVLPGHTFSTYTFRADANDFQAYNITFECTAGNLGQGVAFHSNGDRQILYHCRLLGNQDTYFDNFRTRRYIKDCFIEGGTDFIFGFGVTLFDSCQIHCNKDGGYLTAASTPQYYEFGYVFKHCNLTSGIEVNSVSLGRPWFDWSNTVYFECWETEAIISDGWSKWSDRENTCFYREYHCSGPGSDTTNRIFFGKQLDPAKAPRYVIDTIFAKSNFPTYLGYDGDTAELMFLYRRFEKSGYPERADTILYAGRNVYPSYPTDDWSPEYDSAVYHIIKNNTIRMMDTLNSRITVENILWNTNEIPGFHQDTLSYAIELDDTVMPELSVEGEGIEHITIEYPESIPGQATIKVRSRDKTNGGDYMVYLSKDSAYWCTEVKAIIINSYDTIPTIPGVYEYDYTLPAGKTQVSSAYLITKYSGQYYARTYPETYPGTLIFEVSAIDKKSIATYRINVDLSTSVIPGNSRDTYKISMINPVWDKLYLYYESGQEISPLLHIYDIGGRLLFSIVQKEITAGVNEVDVDISRLDQGVYIYSIMLPDKSIKSKFIKL